MRWDELSRSSPEGVLAWAGPEGRGTKAGAGRGTEARGTTGAPEAGGADMTEAERDLMRAMQEYKQRSGRMFPTWSEILEVLRDLGYEKPASGSAATQ